MKASILIDTKQRVKCYCCGDRRHHSRIKGYRMPAKYLGKMTFDPKAKLWKCNRCAFSFTVDDLNELKPNPETSAIFSIMQSLAK